MNTRRKSPAELFRPLAERAGARSRTGRANPALETIWHVVAAIPRGKVSTYGAVARAAGLAGRARQAGYALRHAPEGMNLPWHRVVGSGGRIAFPDTSRAYREQVRRLKAEGVALRAGRVPAAVLTALDDF